MSKRSKAPVRSRAAREKDIATEAAEEVLSRLEAEPDDFDSDPDDDDIPERARISLASQESSPTVAELAEGKDVFIESYNKLLAQGDMPRFYIYKNHEFSAVKEHPYSWEQLQKEFGGGHFKIIAKSKLKGVYAGSQSQMVAGPNFDQHEEEDDEPVVQQQVPQGPRPIDPLELMNLMQQQQDRAESKARDAAAVSQQGVGQMMQAMVQMQQQAAQQFQMLFMEMTKMNMSSMNQLQTTQLQMFEKLNQQIQMIAQAKDKGIDTMALLKLLNDTESRAENRATKLFELVEAKAEALAEDKAAAMSGHDEKPTLAETLLKGFVPILTAATQGAASGAANPLTPDQIAEDQHKRQLAHQAEQQRRQAIQDRKKAAMADGIRGTVPPAPPKPVNKQDKNLGFPQAQRPAPQAPAAPQIVRDVNPVAEETSDVKAKIFDVVKEDIGNALLFRKEPGQTAALCLLKLEKQGITRHNVLSTFKWDDFLGYAKQFGLPAIAEPWLKEFYSAIQNPTGEEPRPTA